jgi:hypothetical protein
MNKEHCVFIHTNPKQMLGAIVAEHALRRNSKHNERFDVRVISTEDHSFLRQHEGQKYLRDGVERVWLNDDLQSFTPLRFMPPELMDYRGRAVIIDPDIFAVGDIWELLSRDMQGKAIWCRSRSGTKGIIDKCMASSVMLLENAKLTHWKAEAQFHARRSGSSSRSGTTSITCPRARRCSTRHGARRSRGRRVCPSTGARRNDSVCSRPSAG